MCQKVGVWGAKGGQQAGSNKKGEKDLVGDGVSAIKDTLREGKTYVWWDKS